MENEQLKQEKGNWNLFLDDVRMPMDAGNYMPSNCSALYRINHWVIARSFKQFVRLIEQNGIPDIVSFDHDLADEHYRESMDNPDKHYSNYYTDGTFKEKTGYDCAKWMKEYIEENSLPIPVIFCHSMNPIGKENILSLFK